MFFRGFELALLFGLLLGAGGAVAQSDKSAAFNVYGHATFTLPGHDLRDKFDRVNGVPVGLNSLGILFNPGYAFGGSPVQIGLETSWFRMGVQRHAPAGDLEETKSKTRFNGIHLVLRLEPKNAKGKWMPFLDVLGGAGIFTTTTRIDYGIISDIIGYLDSDDNTPEMDNIGKFWDGSFQQGVAAGVHTTGPAGKIRFQARIIYMRGQAVKVSKASEVTVSSSTQIDYKPTVTGSGYVSMQFGVAIPIKN